MVAAAVVGGAVIGGVASSRSASKAASSQKKASNAAITQEKEALEAVRQDLQPFRDVGGAALGPLAALLGVQAPAPQTALQSVTQPQFQPVNLPGFGSFQIPIPQLGKNSPQQLTQGFPAGNYQTEDQFLQNNALLRAANEQTSRAVFANQAARGKLGSGGTLEELQQRFLANSLPVLQNRQANLFNLAALGQNAAAQTGTATQNAAQNVSGLLTGIGNANAASQIAQGNAINQGINTAVGAYALKDAGVISSDIRVKEDISLIGHFHDLPVYRYKYKGKEGYHEGFMAQDVEKVMPQAVIEIGGVKHVDYSEVMNGY